MTGRELIIYILENHLEDEPVFNEGRFLGFLTEEEAAVKMDIGVATIRTWCEIGWMEHIKIEDHYYIPANAERPKL